MANKIGLFAKINTFLGEVRTEMTKVVWPTKEQTKTYTIVVLVSTAVISTATGFWDLGLSWAMQFVFGLL